MRNKDRFDKRVKESTLEVGDKVLVRNIRIRGKHKLTDKWEPSIHVVVERVRDLQVYKVCSQDKNAPVRVLHRDLLLPCGFLNTSEESVPVPDSGNLLNLKHGAKRELNCLGINNRIQKMKSAYSVGSLQEKQG